MSSRITVKKPDAVYVRIEGDQYRRIYVVGDIHGQYDELMGELAALEFNKGTDLLVSVGDIIDRGPKSAECLALIHQPWFCAVRGNHEDLASAALNEKEFGDASAVWTSNGGNWVGRVAPESALHRVIEDIFSTEQWPYVIEIQTHTHKVVVCHACYPYPNYVYGQTIDTFASVWDRHRLENRMRGIGLVTHGADLFIHGHTPVAEPTKYGNHMYIDTFYRANRLTVVRIQ